MNARIVMILVIVGMALLSSGCTMTPPEPETAGTANSTLTRAVGAINSDLLSVREATAANAARLSTLGIAGPEVEAVLRDTLTANPWSVSSVAISRVGIITAAAPDNFRHIVGTDVDYQPAVQKANRLQAPVVSDVFPMEEGFSGISQSYPVFSTNGTYLGYTDLTYRPEVLIGRAVDPVVEGTPYDIWVVQTDGLVIYDTTEEEIGKNLFTDPVYLSPGLQEFFGRVAAEPAGAGVYRFWDRDWDSEVTKEAIWATAGIDGAEWRVVLTTARGPAASVFAAPPEGNGDVPLDTAELDAYVKSAADYALKAGKETALAEFNDPKGRFVSGDRYIFAYEMNGTVLALPFQKGLIGEMRRGVTDTNGVAFIDGLIMAASSGGGHLYYVYPNPADGYREELKLSAVVPVDDRWFVGSGIYLSHLQADFSQASRDGLVQRVKQARDFARQEGREKALFAFNNLSGQWAKGGAYVFAYDMNGTTLALPYQPELVGTNRLGFLDHYGVAALDWEIDVAGRGGGFVYVVYKNPDTGFEALKLCYVTPVDDTWFVGSGVYGETI